MVKIPNEEKIKSVFRRSKAYRDEPTNTRDYTFKHIKTVPEKVGHEGTSSLFSVKHKPTGATFKLEYHDYRGFKYYDITRNSRNKKK